MTQTAYNRITFITSALILLHTLLTGCLPDGQINFVDPIRSYELDGTYCTTSTPDEICLTVNQGTPTAYHWSVNQGQCVESGSLSGGLEFTPDPASHLCLAPSDGRLYSAESYRTPTGLILLLDQSETDCRAQPETMCQHEQLTLELEYTGRND